MTEWFTHKVVTSRGIFNAVDDMGMAANGKYTLQKYNCIWFAITHENSAPEIVEGKLNVQCGRRQE